MNELMKRALAKARETESPKTSKWLARKDFPLGLEDLCEFSGTFQEWKDEIARGRLVAGKLVYLSAFLEWMNTLDEE